MMKGALNFDELCHQVFDGKNDGTNYLAWETDICCGRCGHKLHNGMKNLSRLRRFGLNREEELWSD